MRFRVNTPPVIHQTLDGEVIVINLDTGTYYSINGPGAEIWAAVERGSSLEETVEEAVHRYDAGRPVVEPAVKRFVEELLAEQLLVAAGEDAAAPPPANGNGAPPVPFAEPFLNRYTDMQELLMLDPIHEVDEQGWPSTANGGRT